MPNKDPYGFYTDVGTFLEAEVAPAKTFEFENRYKAATGLVVKPGAPQEYQLQRNKWGVECRIYFNSAKVAAHLSSLGKHVEGNRPYKDHYSYRINSHELWWELVEAYGFRLGVN